MRTKKDSMISAQCTNEAPSVSTNENFLKVVPHETLHPDLSGNKTRPGKGKKKTPVPKLKVVYRNEMLRMNCRDWTGIKVRLKYLKDQFEIEYSNNSTYERLSSPARRGTFFGVRRARQKASQYRKLIKAIDLILSYNGYVGRASLKSGYHVPSSRYTVDTRFELFSDQAFLYIPPVVAETPEQRANLSRAQRAYYNALYAKKKELLNLDQLQGLENLKWLA